MTAQVWTIKDVIQWSNTYLGQAGSDTPRLDAELLLAHSLDCRRLDLYLDHHKPLSPEERKVYRELIRRRATGEPIAYILAYKEFYGLRFVVNRHTLIPRPDTETLVEQLLAFIPVDATWKGLDIGTGSGCIALTIKKLRPSCNLQAWDVSSEALEIAELNSEQLAAPVSFELRDALQQSSWISLKEPLDFIVSNPPYIAPEERSGLGASVIDFEPEAALFAQEQGLQFYKVFAQQAIRVLKPGGKIFLEVGYQQADAVSLLLESYGWSDIVRYRDLGGHDRVIEATCPPLDRE